MNGRLGIGQRDAARDGELLDPLPETPGPTPWHERLPIKDWPRSTQIAAGAAVVFGLAAVVSLAVLSSWVNNAEAWRLQAVGLAADHDEAMDQVEQLEAELDDLGSELATAQRGVEQAREAASAAEDEAQEAAEGELQERMAEAEAELGKAREELAAASAALDEREAQLTQAEAVQARSTFGTGVHLVGQDIEPGTYRTEGTGSCYWARLRGLGGELGDVIANGLPRGPTTVQIHASDVAFESSGCGQWTRR